MAATYIGTPRKSEIKFENAAATLLIMMMMKIEIEIEIEIEKFNKTRWSFIS